MASIGSGGDVVILCDKNLNIVAAEPKNGRRRREAGKSSAACQFPAEYKLF